MTVAVTFTLSIYASGLTLLAYLFCFGTPGVFGGFVPFAFMALAIPLTVALTYWATASALKSH